MKKEKKVTVKDVKTEQPQVTGHNIFMIVKEGSNYKIACGSNYMSRMTFATLEEAKSYIDSKPWELIINTTCYIYGLTSKNSKK